MFPELRIDWVGTGMNGRSDGENKAILRKFCPDKVDGKRRPQDVRLDVLVHVGMAGRRLGHHLRVRSCPPECSQQKQQQ